MLSAAVGRVVIALIRVPSAAMGRGIFGIVLVLAFLILAAVLGGLPTPVLIVTVIAALMLGGVLAVKYFRSGD